MSTEEIITGCQAFDRRAQRALYDRYADELMGTSLRYTTDASQAQDNLHDAFLKIYEKIGQFQLSRGSLMGWMSRIVINEALQKHRRRERITFDTERLQAAEEAVSLSVLDTLAAEDILRLLQQLPEGCRLVFNLGEVEGFNHREISQMLGITPSASRAQLAKAKARLRILIEAQQKDSLKNAS